MPRVLTLWALLAFALSLCGCSGALPPAPSQVGASTTAFVDVAVVPLDSERVLPGQTVLVRRGRIVALGPTSSLPVPAGARVIDGRGKYLMPGLADMHAHLIREEDLLLYLARGVTTVRNMWGAPIHLSWRERVARGELLGPTIITAGPIVDGEDPAHDGSLIVRTPEDADQAVALHKQAGYDFIKVYSRLSAPAYERLLVAARAAGLPVVGHVPRAVGMARAIDAGQASIEHLDAFAEALQADGSPVAGKFDRESRARKLDFVDEGKLPALVQRFRERGAWVCPTRNLRSQDATAEEKRARLQRPEMRYVPGFELAIWRPEGDPPPEVLARNQRDVAFGERLVRALHQGGARLLLGTDTGNPLVVPGFTVHEELALFVQAGLTPYEALRAGTHDAAEFLHAAGEFGTVAVGQRADLLLVEGNPLTDVANADRIVGVMARGRWIGESERAVLLAKVEAFAQGKKDPFASLSPLVGEGRKEFSATYEITWKDVVFDAERVLVERLADGQRVIRAQTFDPHKGQGVTLLLRAGAAGVGQKLELESYGAAGRGRAELTREGAQARLRGTLLSGGEARLEASLPEGAWLGAEGFLASKILLGQTLGGLSVGQKLEVSASDVALGSTAELGVGAWTITRLADTIPEARRYEIATGHGRPTVLSLDAQGWPLGYEIAAHGATVRFRRVGP